MIELPNVGPCTGNRGQFFRAGFNGAEAHTTRFQ